MSNPRISLALEATDALPASGRIALFRPRADTDLSDLPRERLHLIQGFRPDYDALIARGYSVAPVPEGLYAAAIVFMPRSKAEAKGLLAQACAHVARGGSVWVDGAKTDGIDSILKDLRQHLPVDPPISKAHGKIFRFSAPEPEVLADWQAKPKCPVAGFMTLPGVFSADAVDRGSALLGAALPARLPARVADLGAGWGWLSAQILAREGVEEVHLIEAEHAALGCARVNITDPRAQFHWADATRFQPDARLGAVVMNPPFHITRAADVGLGVEFIRAAQAMLSLSGTLYMVANRHLPYVSELRQLFHEVDEIGEDPGFRLMRAQRPIARARAMASPAPRTRR